MSVGLDLDQYHFKKRVLLVFVPRPEDVRYEEQRIYLEDAGEVDEWKIAQFGIFEEGPSFAEERPLSRAESAQAREAFGVEEGNFALHFLALDGTEILRSEEPLPLDVLIDSIPGEGE